MHVSDSVMLPVVVHVQYCEFFIISYKNGTNKKVKKNRLDVNHVHVF